MPTKEQSAIAKWNRQGGGKSNARKIARSIGYRSMGEVKMAVELQKRDAKFEYEPEKWEYQHKPQKYTPDFKVYKGRRVMYIEYKGKLTSDVRKKLKSIKRCNPDKDLRIIFENANNKLSKKSKTRYWQWAESAGFKWSNKELPESWVKSPR